MTNNLLISSCSANNTFVVGMKDKLEKLANILTYSSTFMLKVLFRVILRELQQSLDLVLIQYNLNAQSNIFNFPLVMDLFLANVTVHS